VRASAQKALAKLATLMPNRSPQVTAVWFDLKGRFSRVVGAR
jgi:hypothetical protein